MDINNILQTLYYISGILILIVAILGLNQIRLFKKDLLFRVERAAKEKAIEAARIYTTEFINLINRNLLHRLEKKDLEIILYKGPIGDFTQESVPKELIKGARERRKLLSYMDALNSLESIAAYFTTGVADEMIGYKIIGRSFCATVEYNYDVISLDRTQKPLCHWSNIVDLYKIWAPRLSKDELNNAKQNLENQLSNIKDDRIKIIGQD